MKKIRKIRILDLCRQVTEILYLRLFAEVTCVVRLTKMWTSISTVPAMPQWTSLSNLVYDCAHIVQLTNIYFIKYCITGPSENACMVAPYSMLILHLCICFLW